MKFLRRLICTIGLIFAVALRAGADGWHGNVISKSAVTNRSYPSFNVNTADLQDRPDFRRAKSRKKAVAEEPFAAQTVESGVMSASSMQAAVPQQIVSKVGSLAVALENDPRRIYEYVRNNIAYDHQLGLIRSAEGTLVDGTGSSADQAVLLVELLRAAGYTDAGYAYGWVSLPFNGNDGYNLSNWLGAASFDEACLLMDGAWMRYGVDTTNQLISFAHTWVRVTIDGTTYSLDPSIKPNRLIHSQNIAAWSGYSRSNLLSAAGGTADADAVSGLDETTLRTHLDSLASGLIGSLRTNAPNADLTDVLGGRSIIPENGMGAPRFTVVNPNVEYLDDLGGSDDWIEIGSAWILTSDIGTAPLTVERYWDTNLCVIAGRVTHGTNVLYEGEMFTGTQTNVCRLDVYIKRWAYSSQHGYWDWFNQRESRYYTISGSIGALPFSFGNSSGAGMLRLRAEQLRVALAGTDEKTKTAAALHMVGASWLNQHRLAEQIASELFDEDIIILKLCSGGMVSQSNSSGLDDFVKIDMAHDVSDWIVRSSVTNLIASYRAPLFLSSAMEHGVLEQSQPGTEAASTIKLLTLASRATQQVFRATSANWNNVQSNLTGYSSEELQNLDDLVINQQQTVILPQSGQITVNSWTGSAYIAAASNQMGFTISGGLNGGYGTAILDPLGVAKAVSGLYGLDVPVWHPRSLEPVDLVTGAYVLDHDDLTLGGPLPLTLSRHYSSHSTGRISYIGAGWMHSFELRAEEHSADAQLRLRSPEDAAVLMTGLMVIKDLQQYEDTPKGWLTEALTAQWVMDQMTGHAVSIVLGQKAYTFVQQPDGSYTPPPGMTVSLAKTNGVYVLHERNANTYTFNTNNLIDEIRDPDGNTVTFSYAANTTNLQAVTSSFGPSLTFSYTDALLTSVSDNASTPRTVYYQYDSNNNLTNFTDAAGKNWGAAYADPAHPNAITSLTDPENITTIQNFYNELGIVTQQVSATSNLWNFYIAGFQSVEKDPFGNRTVYEFDELGRTLSVQNALSNRVFNSYDGQNHVTNTVSEAGVTNVFVYDVNHNLLTKREAVGTAEERTTGYGYDSLTRLRFVTNAMGTAEQTVTEYTYTATHHIDTITAAKGKSEERVTDLDYYGNGLLHVKTDPLRTTTFVYDARGNPDTVASTDAGTVNLDYNEAGWLTQVTDQNSVITKYGYNALGLLTNTIHAYGTSVQASESQTYYDNRLLKAVTDARNKTTQYLWTPAYKPSGTVYPDTGSTTNLYDAADRLTHVRDAKQNWTQFQLDALGRVTNTVGEITTVSAQYDSSGQITNTVVDPSGLNLWRKTAYDALNRPLNQQSSIANQQFQYDSLSRLTNRVDPASKAWKTQYDALGQVKKTTRPSGNFEEYGYDAQGRRTLFYNAEHKPMTFGLDAQGRVTAITNAIGNTTSFTYSDAGNLTDRLNAKSETTHYDYNALNRLTNIVHEGQWKASFDYDSNGNIVTQASPLALSSFSYDSMNRLASSLISVNSRSFAVTNSYDLNGNRTNIVYPGGLSVSYSYDEENRLHEVTAAYTNSTKTFTFGYDGAGRLSGIAYPNSVSSAFGYDAESRVTNYTHGAFVNHTITRDPRGFKKTEDIYAGLVPTLTNSLHQTRTHNDADQLTQTTTSLTNQVNYSYDPNGNLTNSAGVSYGWDYDNRLVSVSGGSSSTSTVYLYDAGGVRIGRIENGVTNYFAVNYVDPLKRPLAELNADGSIKRFYVWAGFRLLAHIAVDGGGDPVVRYYHSDELGSTLALTDGAGAVTDQFAYSPYGQLLSRTGTNSAAFLWLGGYGVYYDSTDGLHLTLHRAYSADMRRFISCDPLGIDGGANLYAYGDLNPLAFVDPLGLKTIISHGIIDNSLMNKMAKDLNADVFVWDTSLSAVGGLSTAGNEHFHTGEAARQFEAFIKEVVADNPGEPIDLVLYSGSGQIGINAAELLGDDNIHIRNMILLGAPVNEWAIENVEAIYNFTSLIDPLSWNVNINPNNRIEYKYFNDVIHVDLLGNSDWPQDSDVRAAIKKILK